MIGDWLPLLAALSLGLLAGALLAEDRLLLSYFRTLSPETFYALHPTYGPMLYRFFAPLTVAPPLLTVLSAYMEVSTVGFARSSLIAMVTAVLTSALVAIYFLFFKAANEAFERCSVADADLPAALARWAAWHPVRVVVCVSAFALSLVVV